MTKKLWVRFLTAPISCSWESAVQICLLLFHLWKMNWIKKCLSFSACGISWRKSAELGVMRVETWDWRKSNPGHLFRRPAIGPPCCSRSPTKHWWHCSYARPSSQAWSTQSSFFNLWNLGTGSKFQDIIFNFEKAYFILDELLMAGEMQVGFCFSKTHTNVFLLLVDTFYALRVLLLKNSKLDISKSIVVTLW